jgi:hypothetical protein
MEKLNFKIESITDIEKFFVFLLDHRIFMHPDDSFKECVPDITDFDPAELDMIMDACIDFCDAHDLDIYSIGMRCERDYGIKHNMTVPELLFED